MLIATWNLNNRVGKVRFRPEAADAAISLDADLLVFTEYYPQGHQACFSSTLIKAGWDHQIISEETDEVANRVFIASRIPMERFALKLPDFDRQFPSNLLGVMIPSLGIRIVGLRVPAYPSQSRALLSQAWNWIEATAAFLKSEPSIILGDLNVSLGSEGTKHTEYLSRILQDGWHRATPTRGASFYGHSGRQSEIDHILGTSSCDFSETRYVTETGGFPLVGAPAAISDHAALLTRVAVRQAGCPRFVR